MSIASVAAAPAWRIRFEPFDRLKAGAVAVLFVAVFWPLFDFIPPDFGALVYAWTHEMDWSHGPMIPVFSAYLVYQFWDQIKRCPIRNTWLGAPIMLIGLALYQLTLWQVIPFGYTRELGMMITLLGVIITLCGLPVLYYAWLPWAYLFFAIPLPQQIYFGLTNPLRKWSAEMVSILFGAVPNLIIERSGSNLSYIYQGKRGMIGVADACAGMRLTVALCALGVAVAYLAPRPAWHRLIMVLACIPIATLCNFLRVAITCYLHIFVDPKYSSGTYHMMLGLFILPVAFFLFWGVGWILQHLVVEDADDEAEPPANPRPAKA